MYKNKQRLIEYQREYQRKWIAKRRAEFFKDKCCAKCSSTQNMELDHIDPKTKVANSIWSWSAARRAVEIAKCQVLCGKCHKAKHRPPIKHGSRSGYDQHRCRCELCKRHHSLRLKRQRYGDILDLTRGR